ncbi:MAG: NYN domain-containing protein [Ilumatobacteraceae bacterium]
MTDDFPEPVPGRRYVIDGNNVMGSRPDRWWNDRAGAAARLAQQVAEWSRTHTCPVVLVFDGAPVPEVALLAGGNLAIEFAPRRGRNAADDHIVDLVAANPDPASAVVVTADLGLLARLPTDARACGPRRFLAGIGAPMR